MAEFVDATMVRLGPDDDPAEMYRDTMEKKGSPLTAHVVMEACEAVRMTGDTGEAVISEEKVDVLLGNPAYRCHDFHEELPRRMSEDECTAFCAGMREWAAEYSKRAREEAKEQAKPVALQPVSTSPSLGAVDRLNMGAVTEEAK